MSHRYYGPYEKWIKRPLDCTLATGAFIVLSPVMLVTAALVFVKLGSPVLFRQDRPGMIDPKTGKERIFRLCKFRTMTDKKDENGELLPDEDRLTPFGKLLRSTSLDELPELLNIIRGDMAIVGPRPLLVRYLDRYTPFQRRRQEVRPGLTGLSVSTVRNNAEWERKFELDVEYVDRISFLTDVRIILRTVMVVLKREGINEPGQATMAEFMGYPEHPEK